MTLTTWSRVTPREKPASTDDVPAFEQQRLSEYGPTMPEQEEVTETLTVEEAYEIAQEHASFGDVERDIVARLERSSPEERYLWSNAVEDTRNNSSAFKAMALDPDVPSNIINVVKDPEEWDTLDPMNITKITCSATEKELWQVELEMPNYNQFGPDGVTYVDDSGTEYGGMYVSERDEEYFDVSLDSDEFVNGRILQNMEPENRGSTTIVAFLPDEEDDEVRKLRVEKVGSIRRDLAFSDEETYDLVQDNPETEALINAIIRADEDDDGLEGWVPVEARPENGSSRNMEQKVQEIADTPANEYYFDFPTVAVIGREGAITGKRYVAVPEEHAEDADEWFDPELF